MREEKMKRLIKRLIQWLETQGMSEKQIIACLKFITDDSKNQEEN